MQRRQVLSLSALTLLPLAALAESKPLRLLVPFPPGGATDVTARVLAEPLARWLGQPVVVENRSGAGGSVGMAEVAKAAPDGLTLGVATLSTHGVNPAVYPKLPYDPVKDFAAVTEIVKAPGILLINPKLPVQDMAGFVKYLKANPGKLSYASPGNGTIGHMWGELFKNSTGTFMLHIPYRGAGPALTDLLSGQVEVSFDQVAAALAHVQAGRLRALAVSWPQRLDVLPAVPTYAELNLPSNNDPSWFGLVAPAGTPVTVIGRLQEAVVKSLQEPAVKQRLAQLGLYASGTTPADFAAQIRREIEKMRAVSKVAGISLG
jgi:tripartite-type tricarboxylate transporter receptor subunit TctC